MDARVQMEPLPQRVRRRTFILLIFLFIISLPFLYLYATGYRFDITKPSTLIGTGGMYIAVERTGAQIYIDDKLVRVTRTFRKAFYAQDLDPGTHSVHVQEDGYHTWVKELPVSEHLVTEAQAFNLPLAPTVRVIAPWETATGTMIVHTALPTASTTNAVTATTTKKTTALIQNTEYATLLAHFATTSTTTSPAQKLTITERITTALTEATSTTGAEVSTTTKETNNVRLFESSGDVFARWTGSFDNMPYYYCAAAFPRYSTSTPTTTVSEVPIPKPVSQNVTQNVADPRNVIISPVQTVPKDAVCDPTIRMDRRWQPVTSFDFFPGNTDLVLLVLGDGIYVEEIDNRAWQNMQPLIMGNHLKMYIENGSIYVYDGNLIYQIIPEPS